MREITFEIPGDPPLTIMAREQEGGSILFELTVSDDELADLRGLFFNIADPSILHSLDITGADITEVAYEDVSGFKNGNNVKGGGRSPYDIGLDIGTPGSAKDDIGFTSFVLSSTTGDDLTLDLIAHTEFAARMTSIGLPDSERDGSQKTSVIAPAAPDAIDDSADTLEDVPVTIDVVSNDTDADGDPLTVIDVGAASNGTVEIVDNQILYNANEHWSGIDTFTYTIFDGDGGYDTAIATVSVEAVADAPNLSLDVKDGDTVNEIVIDISSSLVDTDGSESYILSFSDLPDGVVLEGAGDQIINPGGLEVVTLVLEEGKDFDFDFSVSATSTEATNGDTATSTETFNVAFEYNAITENVTFEAVDQSIWTTGDEFVFNDNRFLGVDISDSGSNGGLISTDWSYSLKAGLQSDLEFEGGDINAEIPWQLDFETHYNRTTDVLKIDTAAMLQSGGFFETDGPSLDYMLDFIFNYELYADVDFSLDLGALGSIDEDLFTIDLGPSYNSYTLIDYDSDTSGGISVDFPYGITGTLEWPNLEVSGTETSLGTYTGNGASNNVLDVNLDIDQALADIFLGGVNPFDFGVDLGFIGMNLELVDVDVNAGLNFLQDFQLEAGNLDASLIFEDSTVASFTFGDELIFDSASNLDVDNDGIVEFEVMLDLVNSTLSNDTDLGFNVGYNFDLIKGEWWYDIVVASDSDSFGPLVDLGESFPVTDVDVFYDVLGVNFESETINIIA